MLRNFVFFLSLFCCVKLNEVPSFVHLCKNDPGLAQCFVNTMYEIMPRLIKGIPEMDIPPIDPLYFNTIKVDTGNGRSVNLVIELVNGSVSGLQALKVNSNAMDLDTIVFAADLELPRIQINALYKVHGKILLFELNGGGYSSFNASNLKTHGVWKGKTYMKNNKTHINIDNIAFKDVKIAHMRVKFDNLFGENMALTDTVNNAINENIPSLQEELEPIIKETLGEIIRDYFNRVYRKFPMDLLYPNN